VCLCRSSVLLYVIPPSSSSVVYFFQNFRVVFHFAPVAQPGVDAGVEGAAAGSDVHVDLDAPTSEALVRNAVGPRVDDGVLTAL
jgi:hypothetical protein